MTTIASVVPPSRPRFFFRRAERNGSGRITIRYGLSDKPDILGTRRACALGTPVRTNDYQDRIRISFFFAVFLLSQQ